MKNSMKNSITIQDRLNFLRLPIDRKIEVLKSLIGNFNGLSHSEIMHFVRKTTKFHQDSIDRELKKISNRQKLVYRNNPKISGRL